VGSATVVRLLPEAAVWSELPLLEYRSAPALTHPAPIIFAAHLYRGARPAGDRAYRSIYIDRARVARTQQGAVKSGPGGSHFFLIKKKTGSRPAPDHIFSTFINIPTVNFELGNGLPREFWA
jgi:hypothetical protein